MTTSYYRAYSNLLEVRMEEIQQKKNQYQYMMKANPKEVEEINKIVTKNQHTPIEVLLKYIHKKYQDNGLMYTLIHKLFSSYDTEIAYYVPELVYVAIRKPCKPMKKLLIQRSKTNEALRRLILWNVKAFTVLMKERNAEIKKQIESFEQELIEHVKNKSKFNHSLKAIAMLTQASLTLKKMSPPTLKDKLLKFIQRFNAEILNNLEHGIIIPFRQQQKQNLSAKQKQYMNSNYVVHIVQDDCSCFPTRKRVPYRIIIQTIDPLQLKQQEPSQKFGKVDKINPDQDRDLYNEVEYSVQNLFSHAHFKIDVDNIYVKDNEENKRISQMKNFVFNLEKEQIKEQQMLTKSHLRSMKTISFPMESPKRKNSLSVYRIKPNQNLKKFDSIYIPGKSPDVRRSEMTFNDLNSLESPDNFATLRKSDKHIDKQKENQVQTYIQGEFKDWNLSSQTIWGQAWELKKVKYNMNSFFGKFKSHRLRNVVVKGGDDLRQEIICMQMIYKMRDIIRDTGAEVFIKPYQIIVLSENSGLLQFVSNSISVDEMKKKCEGSNMTKFFNDVFQTEQNLKKAKECFVRSLAGSSILTYVLKLKDRHNGNILLDMDGNIIHIDFGFILGMAPGNLNFESSPFKLTAEYVQLMGGKKSDSYIKFTKLFVDGMCALRRRVDELTLILQIMMEESDLDCFKVFRIEDFMNSFKLHYSQQKYKQYCQTLVERSCMNSRTAHYDTFQYYSNGILP